MGNNLKKNGAKVFRLKRSDMFWVIFVLLFMGGIGVGFCFARNANGVLVCSEKPAFFAVFMLIPLFFVSLSLYSLAAVFRQRLMIVGDEVIAQGVFGTKRFRFSEVTSIDWGTSMMQLTARFPAEKLKIQVGEYGQENFDQIVYLFRTSVPEDRQNDWHKLCYLYSKQRRSRDIEREPADASKGEVLITRRRYDLFFGLGIVPIVVLCVVLVLQFEFEIKRIIGLPLMFAVLWLMTRFTTPTKGYVDESIARRFREDWKGTRARQRHEEIEQFAVTGNLYPEAIFGPLDEGGGGKVE